MQDEHDRQSHSHPTHPANNDGFHVQDPMVRLGFGYAPHRIAFVTDAMAATDCPDDHYLLGALDVNVIDGHARLAHENHH